MKISKDGIYSFLKGFIVAVLILALSPAYAIGENEAEESLIIIGGDYDFPPYEFLDEDGNPTGYNVELTRAIAKVMGMNVVVNLGSWAETYHALEIGKIDAVHGMCYSTERDQKFDFTPPHTMMSHVVFTRQNSPKISSLEDLRDKEVIVMRGSIMHEYVMKNQLTDKIILVETQPKALRLLSSGKHDFALMARLSALYSIKKMKLLNILATDIMVSERNYCYAVKEGDVQILARLSEGLVFLKQTGQYQEIYNKWIGALGKKAIAKAVVKKYALIVLLPLLLLLAGTLFWSWSLRRNVFERTMELAREIGKRKQMEQKLRESEEKFRSISDSANDAIVMMDNSGNISFWNEAAKRIFGYLAEEALGKDLHKLIAPERYYRSFKENFVKFKIKGEGPSIGRARELDAIKKDGTEFPIELSLSSVKLEDEWHAIGIVRDITERKKAEKELKEKQALSDLLLNSLPHPTILVDKNRIILAANTIALDFGAKIGDYCWKEFARSEYLSEEDKERLEQNPNAEGIQCTFCLADESLEESKPTQNSEVHMFGRIWDTRWVPLGKEKYLHYAIDITERKKSEEKIMASLEEKELLLDEVHFRVRNNMQIISSILALQSATYDDEKVIDAFNECQNRIKSMALVHGELYRTKDFSRIDFKEYIETLTQTLLDSYKKKAQAVSLKIDAKEIFLDIDTAIDLGLVLNELVTNSLKHAFPEKREGEIQISLQNIDKEKIELKVKDNGIGLPDGFNIRNTDSLGLKLVTLLAEVQLQGEVRVKQDNGTEFQLIIKKTR
jgi:PAS domain S-box-containing protein